MSLSLSLSLLLTLSLSLSRVLKFFVITILIDLIYSSTCLQFDTYFSKPFQHSCNWNYTEISRFQIYLDIYKSKRVRTYICTVYIQTVRCVYYWLEDTLSPQIDIVASQWFCVHSFFVEIEWTQHPWLATMPDR